MNRVALDQDLPETNLQNGCSQKAATASENPLQLNAALNNLRYCSSNETPHSNVTINVIPKPFTDTILNTENLDNKSTVQNSDVDNMQRPASQLENLRNEAVSTSEIWRLDLEAASDELKAISALKAQEKHSAQINAAIKSLETNLILSVSIALILLAAYNYSNTSVVFIMSLAKGTAPILTTMANFGKIQEIILMYFKKFGK